MLLSIGEAAGLNIDGLIAAVFDGLQRFPNFSQLLALLLFENIFPENLEALADDLRSCVRLDLRLLPTSRGYLSETSMHGI